MKKLTPLKHFKIKNPNTIIGGGQRKSQMQRWQINTELQTK